MSHMMWLLFHDHQLVQELARDTQVLLITSHFNGYSILITCGLLKVIHQGHEVFIGAIVYGINNP